MPWRINKVHKWLGVGVGAILFIWVVSGVVIILPGGGADQGGRSAPVEYARMTISPAAAVRALLERERVAAPVRDIKLTSIFGDPVYVVEAATRTYLINASTGEPISISARTAERIAQQSYPGATPVGPAQRFERHDPLSYPWGPLPAYRVEFADGRGTVLYVSARDGTVQRSDRVRKIRNAVQSLHRFYPVQAVFGRAAQDLALYVASTVSLVAIVTGYYLAFWWGRKRSGVG